MFRSNGPRQAVRSIWRRGSGRIQTFAAAGHSLVTVLPAGGNVRCSVAGGRTVRRQLRLGKGNRGVADTSYSIALNFFPNMHRFAVCIDRAVVGLFDERPIGR